MVIKASLRKIGLLCKEKPCFHLELDSKTPSKENIIKEKEVVGIHS